MWRLIYSEKTIRRYDMAITVYLEGGYNFVIQGEDDKAIQKSDRGWREGILKGGKMDNCRVRWQGCKVLLMIYQTDRDCERKKERR